MAEDREDIAALFGIADVLADMDCSDKEEVIRTVDAVTDDLRRLAQEMSDAADYADSIQGIELVVPEDGGESHGTEATDEG